MKLLLSKILARSRSDKIPLKSSLRFPWRLNKIPLKSAAILLLYKCSYKGASMWCNSVPTNILLKVCSMPFHHLFHDLCCQSIVTTIYHLRYFSTLWHIKCELDSVYFVLELTGLLTGVFFNFFLLLIPKMFNAFPWLSKTHTSISGLSRPGKWNSQILWLSRFSMTHINYK